MIIQPPYTSCRLCGSTPDLSLFDQHLAGLSNKTISSVPRSLRDQKSSREIDRLWKKLESGPLWAISWTTISTGSCPSKQHYRPCIPGHDIGRAWQIVAVQTKAIAESVQTVIMGLGVLLAYTGPQGPCTPRTVEPQAGVGAKSLLLLYSRHLSAAYVAAISDSLLGSLPLLRLLSCRKGSQPPLYSPGSDDGMAARLRMSTLQNRHLQIP